MTTATLHRPLPARWVGLLREGGAVQVGVGPLRRGGATYVLGIEGVTHSSGHAVGNMCYSTPACRGCVCEVEEEAEVVYCVVFSVQCLKCYGLFTTAALPLCDACVSPVIEMLQVVMLCASYPPSGWLCGVS